jgi:predicted nucleic acid-binding Zn ribbon protein
MKKTNHLFTISEALDLITKDKRMTKGLTESVIKEKWAEMMGKTIAEHTTLLYVKDRILYLYFNSSVIKNEVNLSKQKVIEIVNETIGETTITDVIVK